MKDYERYVIWVDYFNSELKRAQGRRIPLSLATKAPKLGELEAAARKLGLDPQSQPARYPSSASGESGYVSIRKAEPKKALIAKIAKEMSAARGQAQKKQNQSSASPKSK